MPKPRTAVSKLMPPVGTPSTIGDIFYGSKGYIAMGDEDANLYRTSLGEEQRPGPTEHEGGNDFHNFNDCVRSRRSQDLHAPIEAGHISCGLLHLANASYRLGRTPQFDLDTKQAIGDDKANLLLRDGDRGYRPPFVISESV